MAQPPYHNTVAVGRTTLSPEDLLAISKALEWQAGRRPAPRLSARPLDIDLLLYGERVLDRPELQVPHARIEKRRFVLQPLVDLCPEWRLATLGLTARELLEGVSSQQQVELVEWEWRETFLGIDGPAALPVTGE